MMKVVTRTHRYWRIKEIPSTTFDDLPKYLGVCITPTQDVQLPRRKWEGYLKNVERSVKAYSKGASNQTCCNSKDSILPTS